MDTGSGAVPTSMFGEMVAVGPAQRRSANVVAADRHEHGGGFHRPRQSISSDISLHRAGNWLHLLQRNALVASLREKIRIFIVCSTEALPIAAAIQNAFASDPLTTVVWTDGVFRATNYPLEILEAKVDDSDLAIAIPHADDLSANRGTTWPRPRDNVFFQLGHLWGDSGEVGRSLWSRERNNSASKRLRRRDNDHLWFREWRGSCRTQLAPANRLREHINALGPNNG